MNRIYLDNSATTPLCKAARAAMTNAMEHYGNPSSLHESGADAAARLKNDRAAVCAALGMRDATAGQLIFTGCGTEANTLAVCGVAAAKPKKGERTVLSTDSEHPSVENNLRRLEKEGYRVVRLSTRGGELDFSAAEPYLDSSLFMVTAMLVNNETGARYRVEELFRMAHEKNPRCLCHCDATQAFLKVPFSFDTLGADLLTVSAHKIGGPKGVGALYARRGIILTNIIEGGAQERGKRAGTENVPGIVGMAAALKDACDHLDENAKKVSALRDRLIAGLRKIPHCALNGAESPRLPGNVNFCFEGIEGESLLLLLDAKGISASSGSACTSGSLDPSHVLLAIGRPHEVAHGSLRLTLCEENTMEEVEYMLDAIPQVVTYLRNMSPVWKELERGEKQFML